jgi:hypothetical protein
LQTEWPESSVFTPGMQSNNQRAHKVHHQSLLSNLVKNNPRLGYALTLSLAKTGGKDHAGVKLWA